MSEVLILQMNTQQLRNILREEIQSTLEDRKEFQSQDKILTIQELAQELKVSIPTIHAWKKSQKVPYFKQGKKILFRLNEVLASYNKHEKLKG